MSSRFDRGLCRALVALIGIHIASAAFAAAGDLDPNFGQYGRAFYSIPSTAITAARYLRQSDGKIVIAGYSQVAGVNPDMLIVRLNADGTADLSFGNAGRVQIDFAGGFDFASAVDQQADGKLVVAGYTATATGGSSTPAVVRLNTDGALDPTFGSVGRVTFASTLIGPLNGVAALSDGKILVAGWRGNGPGYAVIKLDSSGAMDTTFGVSGIAGNNMPINGYGVSGMLVQADGRILVYGTTYQNPVWSAGLVRFTATGQPDSSFNGTGYLLTPCSVSLGSCYWSDAVQQSDQKIVLAGYQGGPGLTGPIPLTQYGSQLLRINGNGSVDTAFGTNGLVTSVFANAYYGQPLHSSEMARRVELDAAGNILVLGSTLNYTYSPASAQAATTWDAVVGRFNTSGVLDPSFGFNGYAIVDFSSGADLGFSFAVDFGLLPDGSPLVVATRNNGTTSVIGVAKLSTGASAAGIVRLNGLTAKYSETAGEAVFRVRRTGGTSGIVSVNYSTSSGTATAGADYLDVSGTLTWANGESMEKIVTVPIISDSVVEAADESFTLNLSNPTGGVRIDGAPISATIARDDLAPEVAFQVSQRALSANEGQGSVSITVTRSGTSTGAAAITYFTLPGSATPGQDYTSTRGVLVWTAGDMSARTVVIPISDDATTESAENFHLLLVNGTGVTLNGAKTTVTLVDNDGPPQISMLTAAVSVNESQSSIALTVVRSGAATQAVSVNYTTTAGTASAGADFTTTTNTLTWLPTDPDEKVIVIPLIADTAYEGNETFAVTLSGVTGGATIGTAATAVTIVDDDAAPPPPPPPAPVASDDSGGGALDAFWLAMLSVAAMYARGRGRLRRRSRVAV